ncbi:uncharacterized protein LOC131151297 [Malania oleifera]|uniref:uncharacterized protein LOC131151297 n=1 Tax=Malania oleifera TaxID=397392 RepID=UPI0025AE524B|nr:uncharacterized protein LOC131151297 [Malania oleifera]
MRINPPAFTGGPDLVAVENWVQEIEEIMVELNCTDKQMVRYAAFKMTGEAKRWWLSMKLLEDQRGDMTVAEYTAKFVELSRFAPFLIPNEVRKYVRCKIYELVVRFQVQSFSELVDKASVLEKSIQSSIESSEQKKTPAPSSF